MTDSFGIDTAGCNGIAHWEIAKAHGVHYGAARATISWGYQDKWFPNSWQGMKQQAIHRFAYHVLYPSQSYKSQAENFLRVVGNQWDDTFPVNDFELDQGCSKAQITDCILNFNEYVSQRAPKIVNYSRKTWVDAYTELGDWRKQYDWWLSQFLNDRSIEDTRSPDLPTGVSTYLIHQNADHYPAFPGFTPESLSMDTNRWNGEDTAADIYFGIQAPSVLTTEQQVKILWREAEKQSNWNLNP
jgi:GH25 family lysozyme M1 (1,4-beta-N-acetylmuramidase)